MHILLAQVDSLKSSMPKKLLKKIETQARLAQEQELEGLGGDRSRSKNRSCTVS